MQHVSSTQSLAFALGLGSLISLVCSRLRIPAILPLLGAGLVLGRSGLHLVGTHKLGDALDAFITVAIAVLVFEGGLHLSRGELGRASRAVIGLLTVGALTTWVLTTMSARLVLGVTWPSSWLMGSILIVTGPTVVQPLLRRYKLTPGLTTSLGAEAVLIDPIGVLAVVTTLDLVAAGATRLGSEHWPVVLTRAGPPLLAGVACGAAIGLGVLALLRAAARRERTEARQLNLLAMGACMSSVGVGEWLAPQGGLLAATVCAIIVANMRVIGAQDVRQFKEQIASILVGALFILLASRLEIGQLAGLTWRDWLFVAAMMFIVRPLSVTLATARSELSGPERLYACLFAPRGVVAASVVSIAATRLGALALDAAASPGPLDPGRAGQLAAEASHLQATMFLLIIVTVVWASVAGFLLALLLGVRAGPASGVVIVGGHPLGAGVGRELVRRGIAVWVVDSNEANVAACRAAGLRALKGDATDTRWLDEQIHAGEAGWVISWTGNRTVDQMVERWAGERLGAGRAMTWETSLLAGAYETGPALLAKDIGQGAAVVGAWPKNGDGGTPVAYVERGRVWLAGRHEPAGPLHECIGVRGGAGGDER